MVAMVLLLIICLSSAYFFAIPPFRKEALRFAALERAAGMLDLMYWFQGIPAVYKPGLENLNGFYGVSDSGGVSLPVSSSDGSLLPLTISTNMPPVWYTFKVATATTVVSAVSGVLEAEIKLYGDRMDTNTIFATFKMLLPPTGP